MTLLGAGSALTLGCGQHDAVAPTSTGDQGTIFPPSTPDSGGGSNTVTLVPFTLTPKFAELSTAAPGSTVQLVVGVAGPDGAPPTFEAPPTFTTNDSTIAAVDSTGLITAVSPGAVLVTVAARLAPHVFGDGVMVARVRAPITGAGGYAEVGGTYDLSIVVERAGDWEGPVGTRWKAVVTIQQEPGSSTLTGSFTDLSTTTPDGQSYSGPGGRICGSVDLEGRIDLEFSFAENETIDMLVAGTLTANQITGTATAPFAIWRGPATLVRR
jgi:hypothetical protein